MNKNEIKNCWLDGIAEALDMANEAIKVNPADEGTCNFDKCLVRIEKSIFSMKETIEIFALAGVKASKYNRDYISIDEIKGQAERNTLWHKTFKEYLEENGYSCDFHYQMD